MMETFIVLGLCFILYEALDFFQGCVHNAPTPPTPHKRKNLQDNIHPDVNESKTSTIAAETTTTTSSTTSSNILSKFTENKIFPENTFSTCDRIPLSLDLKRTTLINNEGQSLSYESDDDNDDSDSVCSESKKVFSISENLEEVNLI